MAAQRYGALVGRVLSRNPRNGPLAEVRPIIWKGGKLRLLDQRKLPQHELYVECSRARDTANAIRNMTVRGAPAIGVAAAFGMAMESRCFRRGRLIEDFDKAAELLMAARPTAVNLGWALRRLRSVMAAAGPTPDAAMLTRLLADEAVALMSEDVEVNRAIGGYGAALLAGQDSVLTHCNAGALATAGYGTAIGVIRRAWEDNPALQAYVTETRPFLQGARLTSWELLKLGISVTLISDGMVGHLLQSHPIGAVVVGTDRTAANGDVANKIGTYQLAVLARRHGVPFYVAAPTSSIDLDCADGSAIPIEQRAASELTHIGRRRIAPEGVKVFNPAFDVTPAELVDGIITEYGVVTGDFKSGLAEAVDKGRRTTTGRPRA